MIDELLFALWFFLPAGLANATPVFANKIPLLNRWKTPMDFGKSFRGKRIFGANKTWRGLVFSSLVGVVISGLSYQLYDNYFTRLNMNPEQPLLTALLIGFLLGAGALVGDAVESFVKRQLNKNPGDAWFPFDQTDYIIGALLFVSPLVALSTLQMIAIGAFWFVSHLLGVYIGFLLHLRDKPI